MFQIFWRILLMITIIALFHFLPTPQTSTAITTEYQQTVWELQLQQKDLQKAYGRSWTQVTQNKVIDSARQHIFDKIKNQLYPHWKGTRWAYSGTTETPRQGKIACGYFVSTLLRDVGFELERVKLAQQASEKIVKTFASEEDIKRFRNKSIKTFVKEVIAMGDGLYIVGLDTHVGMMLVENGKAQFVHSAKSLLSGVRAENPLKSKVLKKSKYRIVGKALSDEVILKWLKGQKVKTYLQ
ncbi:MAG: hypothetical protein ACPG49_09215 [Chitinophagales bacterium]